MQDALPLTIGTAGHVDHGKTTLLDRLAGGAPDADRLPEEKARGLTIDIGYAEIEIEKGRKVGVVDVPGHERFVRNMVAAASGIDFLLLVVAADDGVMPQTREHLEIADLLGVKAGVVALTKVDLVDPELLLFAEEEIRDLLSATTLAGSPIVRVSSTTGEGVEELRKTIVAALENVEPRPAGGVFRLPVQRSFALPGHGTVVTGVPLSGHVTSGDTLEVIPGNRKCRVRSIQVYHEEAASARAGHRTALKLSDVSWKEVRRGDVVSEPGYLAASNMIEARFFHLPRWGRPVRSNTEVRFHSGTAEVLGRIFVLTAKEVAPGASELVQIRLDRPVVVAPGDFYVLRHPSPQITLGGGRIVGPSSRRITRGRSRLVKRAVEREEALSDVSRGILHSIRIGGLTPRSTADVARDLVVRTEDLERHVGRLLSSGELVSVGERFISAAAAIRGRARLVEILTRFHEKEPLRRASDRGPVRERLGAEEPVLAALVSAETKVEAIDGGRLRIAGFAPRLSDEQQATLEEMEELIRSSGLATPKEGELAPELATTAEEAEKLLDLLLDRGAVVRIGQGVVFHRESVERAKETIADRIRAAGSLAPSDLKELLGMTRKYSIPLLEWLDATRFTIRQGDRRILA